MNGLSSPSAPDNEAIISKTPEQAPTSFKLSPPPPPSKKHRMSHHIAASIKNQTGCDSEPSSSSSLTSIIHGHHLTTPRDFSSAPNLESFFSPPLADTDQKHIRNLSGHNDTMDEKMADLEAAMFAKNRSGHKFRPSLHRTASVVESGAEKPVFPADNEFIELSNDRKRFVLLPRISLFQEAYYDPDE